MKIRLPCKTESDVTRDEWGETQTTCWICGWKGSAVNPLTTHEIARGPNRQAALKEPAAWFRCCLRCHAEELDSMPIAKQQAYKLLYDITHYSRERVNELRHRAKDAVSEADVALEIAAIFHRRVA